MHRKKVLSKKIKNPQKWLRKVKAIEFRLLWNALSTKQVACQVLQGILLPKTGKIHPNVWS
jgi:hypothetical protein